MSRRVRRWWNIVGKLWDAMMDWAEERIPDELSLASDLRTMIEVLDLRAETASYAMAVAGEKRGLLEQAVESYEAWGREAERFLRSGDRQKSERGLMRQLEEKKKIAALTEECRGLQNDAERHVRELRVSQRHTLRNIITQRALSDRWSLFSKGGEYGNIARIARSVSGRIYE